MITYLIHTTSIWIILFLAYRILLSKEKYFILNRIYLLASLALGLLLPLVQFIDFSSAQVIPEVSAIYHQQVEYISQLSTSVRSAGVESTSIDWTVILFYTISVGMAVMLLRNILAGYKIGNLYRDSEKIHHRDFTEVRTQKEHLPFSFFRYIFFSVFSLKETDRLTILNHEIHHVKAKHTWDILFVEMIKVFFWWNPIVYLYKKAITENHEYAADHAAISKVSRKEYCELLLQSNMPGVNLDLGHPFFQTYIKKRIDMMYRKQTNWKGYLKFVLPVMAIVLMAFVIQKDELIELDYQFGNQHIDLFANDNLLEPGVDYLIDRERGKIVIINAKYNDDIRRTYCMFTIDEPRDPSYYKLQRSKPIQTDVIAIKLINDGVLLSGEREVTIDDVFRMVDDIESENRTKVNIKLSVEDDVESQHVAIFLDAAFKKGKEVVLHSDEKVGIPSISPIAHDAIKNSDLEKTGYGMREHPIHHVNQFHKGIDLVANMGTPVYSTANGIVSTTKTMKSSYGKHIIIDHNDGYQSLYAHLISYIVDEGDHVKQGDQIGFVGSTGASTHPHLHYEVRVDGKAVDPIKYGLERIASSARKNEDEEDLNGRLKEGAKSLFGIKSEMKFEEEGQIKVNFEKLQENNINRSDFQLFTGNQIKLGPKVVGDVIVKSNNTMLKEGVDYNLDCTTGVMTILNKKLLKNENPIHIEFTSDEMDKIVYARKWSLEVDEKVASDMVYVKKCEASKDGIYFIADKMPRLITCNSGNVEDDFNCSRNKLSDYINENKMYPESMVKKGFEGKVIFKVVVDENGNIIDYEEVLRKKRGDNYPEIVAEGNRLLELVKSNKEIIPAQCNGENVKSSFHLSFNFKLDAEQMKRVERKDASNTPNPNQKTTFTGAWKGGLGYTYHTEMNVPYTVKIMDPLGQVIYNESFDYIYKSKREGVEVSNSINGEYKIEVTQDGKTVTSKMDVSIF